MKSYDRDVLEAALMGYEQQQKTVEAKIEEIRTLLGVPEKRKRGRPKSVSVPRKKRKVSAEARQKMAEAQRRRWAAVSK